MASPGLRRSVWMEDARIWQRATSISLEDTQIHSTMASPAYYESLLSSAKRLRVRFIAQDKVRADIDSIPDICSKAFP